MVTATSPGAAPAAEPRSGRRAHPSASAWPSPHGARGRRCSCRGSASVRRFRALPRRRAPDGRDPASAACRRSAGRAPPAAGPRPVLRGPAPPAGRPPLASSDPGPGRESPGRAPPSGGTGRERRPASTSPRRRQLILRGLDSLLDLPAIGLRLAAVEPLELRPRILELALCDRGIDLANVDGGVDEGERPILLDREEAGSGRELVDLFCIAVRVDAGRARFQQRDQRRVAGEDPHLPPRTPDDE